MCDDLIINCGKSKNQSLKFIKGIPQGCKEIGIIQFELNLLIVTDHKNAKCTWVAVVHLNFRSGSTFPVQVSTAPHGHWVNKEHNQAGAPRLTRSDFMLHIGYIYFY